MAPSVPPGCPLGHHMPLGVEWTFLGQLKMNPNAHAPLFTPPPLFCGTLVVRAALLRGCLLACRAAALQRHQRGAPSGRARHTATPLPAPHSKSHAGGSRFPILAPAALSSAPRVAPLPLNINARAMFPRHRPCAALCAVCFWVHVLPSVAAPATKRRARGMLHPGASRAGARRAQGWLTHGPGRGGVCVNTCVWIDP